MKEDLIIAGILIGIFVAGGIAGYSILKVTKETTKEKILDGMWMDARNWSQAYQTVKEKDPSGDWICINLVGMSYDRMLEVIQHEIGHELFAEKCEQNITKCIEAVGA